MTLFYSLSRYAYVNGNPYKYADPDDKSEPTEKKGKTKKSVVRDLKPGETIDEAFDNFPGEVGEAQNGDPIKTAEDGTVAYKHNSSRDNGRKILTIRKPKSKPRKYRE